MLLEIYSDLICPWCYIGLHRLRAALARRPGVRIERRWQPFELNPDMPPGGMDRTSYLAAKFGGLDRARQVYGMIEETAARDGVPMNLQRIRRTPNTRNAHRLVRVAGRLGVEEAVVEALFRAYFIEGQDLGDPAVLCAAAAGCGLDPEEIRIHLAGEADTGAIRTAQAVARQLGIQAVPCFIFDRRYALAGAQEPATFMPLLDIAADEARVSANTAV